MHPATLPFVLLIVAGSCWLAPAHGSAPAKPTGTRENAPKLDLKGVYKGPQGMLLKLGTNGDFVVSKRDANSKRALLKGSFRLLFESDTQGKPEDEGFGCITVFVAEVVIGEEKTIIPGCYYAGEGDPPHVRLFELDNDFGRQLRKNFAIKSQEVITLVGPPPP